MPSFGDVRGVPSSEPALQATLKVVTAGLPDGASALFLVTGQVQADSGHMADLGTAEPVFEQLSYVLTSRGSSTPRCGGACRRPGSNGWSRSALAAGS